MLTWRVLMEFDQAVIRARAWLVVIAVAGLSLSSTVQAFDVGHSRVVSSPGQSLVVDIPLRNITAQEAQSLKVSLLPASAWQAADLTPPVAIDRLQVSILAGTNASSRVIRLSSPDVSSQTVINVLLEATTDSARRVIQTSVIVLPPPTVRVAGDQTVTVMRGDTLIGIANRFPVSGANLYQMLWALYQTNPGAFISENMNLLKAGAALNIPDAASVRAIDPAFARARYLAHVQAFQRMRGSGSAIPAGSAESSSAPAPSAQDRGQVEPAPIATGPATEDQVRLSSAPIDIAADQQTSQARALAEDQSRTEALKNIEALQGAVAAAGSDPTSSANRLDPNATSTDATSNTAKSAGTSTADVQPGSSGEQTPTRAAETAAAAASGTQTNGSAASLTSTDQATTAVTQGGAGVESGSLASTGEQTANQTEEKTAETAAAAASATQTNGSTTSLTSTDQATTAASDGGAGIGSGAAGSGAVGTSAAGTGAAGTGAAGTGAAGTGAAASDAATAAGRSAPGIGQGASQPGSAEPAQDAVTQAIDWVKNNVAASIAIVLALFALILAWVLRATGRPEKAQAVGVTALKDPQKAFEEKLQSIDLSLDDPKPADASEPVKTDKPAGTKPDGSA